MSLRLELVSPYLPDEATAFLVTREPNEWLKTLKKCGHRDFQIDLGLAVLQLPNWRTISDASLMIEKITKKKIKKIPKERHKDFEYLQKVFKARETTKPAPAAAPTPPNPRALANIGASCWMNTLLQHLQATNDFEALLTQPVHTQFEGTERTHLEELQRKLQFIVTEMRRSHPIKRTDLEELFALFKKCDLLPPDEGARQFAKKLEPVVSSKEKGIPLQWTLNDIKELAALAKTRDPTFSQLLEKMITGMGKKITPSENDRREADTLSLKNYTLYKSAFSHQADIVEVLSLLFFRFGNSRGSIRKKECRKGADGEYVTVRSIEPAHYMSLPVRQNGQTLTQLLSSELCNYRAEIRGASGAYEPVYYDTKIATDRVLTFRINRFNNSNPTIERTINIKPFSITTEDQFYDLERIVCRSGSDKESAGGHVWYLAKVNGKWMKYNDSEVTEITSDTDLQIELDNHAYMPFYYTQRLK